MLKALHHVPELDESALRSQAAGWKGALQSAAIGARRIVIEWSVVRGPSCLVYPAWNRALGRNLTLGFDGRQSDERWADFLEFDFVPRAVRVLKEEGLPVQAICVDLRPVQVQRARRRVLQAAALSRTGDAHAAADLAGPPVEP
jgi:hypothetical protein